LPDGLWLFPAVRALWDRGTLGYRRGLIATVGLVVGSLEFTQL